MDMDKLRPWALLGLVLGPLLLASHIRTSFALERPTHSAAVVLAAIGCFFVLCARLLPRYFHDNSLAQSYTTVPLSQIEDEPASEPSSPQLSDITHNPPSIRHLRLAFVFLVVAVCLRVELIRRILQTIQCTRNGYTVLLPLLFVALDYCTVQSRNMLHSADESIDDSVYDLVAHYWSRNSLRYLLPTALLTLSSAVILRSDSTPGSTYVCPAATLATHQATLARLLSLPLDFCIVYCINLIFQSSTSSRKSQIARPFTAVGYAALVAAFMISCTGIVYFIFSPNDRHWVMTMPKGYKSSLATLMLLSCITALSACLSIHFFTVVGSTTVVVFTMMSASAIASSWHNMHPFPPASENSTYFFYCCAVLAFATILITQSVSDQHSRHSRVVFTHIPGWFIGLLFLLFMTRTILWFGHTSHVNFHPVDMLIFEAKARHGQYVSWACSSTDLPGAVERYKVRYGRHPPPGFEQWYEYATTRKSKITDEFDRIHDDLLPYWAISPTEVRQRTWQVISNPWNDVAGISIRNGSAQISPNVVPTHRWMLDGVVEMINHFSQWLPDMDLGFNLNDESRVSVPYEIMEGLRKRARPSGKLDQAMSNTFTEGREETWSAIPEEPIRETPFKELSWQQTFFEFGNSACPAGSAARDSRYWDTGHLCTSCTAPHSLGAFLSDWAMSADICHQPDMANLHGFYLSPAAFKATHDLIPVFSQSKAPGYNDIVYPSAWNYMDKVKYEPNEEHPDPSFVSKQRTLFWRGATSEGVSAGLGPWKGMSRQRFVHLANNINNTTPPQPILLKTASHDKYGYVSAPISELTKHMSVDVHIVDNIARCGGRDCTTQSAEFAPLVPPTDFQSHWSYRYLLDLDGAGFSGRFLPFLASRSLPFKAALFREWYDSRLTPWVHFVPLDLRGHGFWASLVYFAGLEGVVGGARVSIAAHDKEGEMIATKGREWAAQVLRKEDMEIYFFRLLLEWGRLTDDRRDELGFTLT